MNILRKRAQNVKKHNDFTFPDYLPMKTRKVNAKR